MLQLYLFLAIGVTVEHFLCPALAVISNTLGLSESVAGVTFLAFGNGAADIFSIFVLITTVRIRQHYNLNVP